MNANDIFDELYAKLNAEQKEAVDTIEGPVMVVAGPGTGKTQILTLRIANILRKTDIHPENILALTFTESSAVSMRRRLVNIIGSSAYSVVLSTFHSFCNEVIRNYPEEFPRIIGSQSITEIDQVKILEEIIDKTALQELKPFGDPFYYLRPALQNINNLKREGISPAEFASVVKKEREVFESDPDKFHQKGRYAGKMKGDYQKLDKQIRKNEELLKIYGEYQKELAKAKYYDWSDMIMEVYEALTRNENLLLMLQEKHQYILVDEHQDTNNAQNRILELLASFYENPNIFVVGDEKQAIFRFQGASLENFLYFKKRYPDAKLITLQENYRSTQPILDSAESLITSEKGLKSNVQYDKDKTALYSFSRPEVEMFFLAEDISKRIKDGLDPKEIAVIYRDNHDAFPIARVFEKYNIPFAIESDQDVLEDEEIKKLVFLLRAIENFGKDEFTFEAMHIDFLNINPLDIYALIDFCRTEKKSILDLMRFPDIFAGLSLKNADAVKDFFHHLSEWKITEKNTDIVAFFERVVRESGFLAHLFSRKDSVEKMDKLVVFFDEVKALAEVHRGMSLDGLIEHIDMLKNHNVAIKKAGSRRITPQVRLMTAHKAKGLEFDVVYIIKAYDGHWGNKRKSNVLPLIPRTFSLFGNSIIENATDDERRLFYVALTRAKKGVVISFSRMDEGGRERVPSQFLSEMNMSLIDERDASEYENEYETKKSQIFDEARISGTEIGDKNFVREVFVRNGLSVTGLNNYLECPWKYFYTNLLRIPKAKTKHQMYGIAVHAALKDFFENIKKRDIGKDFLLQRFEFYLNKEPLTPNDFKASLAKGKKSLGGYFDAYKSVWKTRTLTEFSIRGAMLTPEVRLTGVLDKLEILDDIGNVNVVDYKTSKPKSRGKIEGKESGEQTEGSIRRQLVFYKILLDLYKEGGKFKMVSGDIDFVEPDAKGKYHKESFELRDEEVEELKTLILKVAEEIMNLSFWDSFCKDNKCEFCALRKTMR